MSTFHNNNILNLTTPPISGGYGGGYSGGYGGKLSLGIFGILKCLRRDSGVIIPRGVGTIVRTFEICRASNVTKNSKYHSSTIIMLSGLKL